MGNSTTPWGDALKESTPAPITRPSDYSHLVPNDVLLQSGRGIIKSSREDFDPMSDPTYSGTGADWTQLLTDPALVSHLGELLQVYRDTPAEQRDQALLEAMRNIKSGKGTVAATSKAVAASAAQPAAIAQSAPAAPVVTSPAASPPFEPDIFTPTWGQDRRRHARLRCFVAVELRLGDSGVPIWGNLSNTSLGGCFVETATPVPSGVSVEIGLWLANGKIWIKGLILTGIVTKSSPSFGVRIKFSELEATERENLRHFLKFVESTTKGYNSEHGYLAQMKR
jgi:PilZ domain